MTPKAYRMTITIPPGVKEQMDQVGEQVNWSAVASEAFQRKVVEIRTGRNQKLTMHKVLERLQAAGQADPNGYEAGWKFGQKWVEDKALPRHLRNLARYSQAVFAQPAEGDDRLLCWRLASAITGEDDSFEQFWLKAVGSDGETRACHEDFVRGFVAGALEVWEEVKRST